MTIVFCVGVFVFKNPQNSTKCFEANSTVLAPNPVMSERVDPRLRHGDVQKPAAPEKQGKDSEKTPDEEAENSKANTTPRTYDIATAKPSSEESYGLDMDLDDDRNASGTEFLHGKA